MRARWVFCLFVFIGCTEDEFPGGIYGYQVERLLSGGSEKIWLQVVQSNNCQDSVQLLVRASEDLPDSITISQLTPNVDCSGFDTLALGNASASFISTGQLFTDSLNFASGSFWIVESITSNTFSYRNTDVQISYISR